MRRQSECIEEQICLCLIEKNERRSCVLFIVEGERSWWRKGDLKGKAEVNKAVNKKTNNK